MPAILETERLILRPPVEADLDGFAELMGDEQSARFIGGVQTRSAAWRGMAMMSGSWMLKGFSMFSVIERDSGAWIGRIGPWSPEGWPGTEVGWGLLRPWWSRGYAAEAAAAAIDWAFDALGWSEVIHTIASENIPSKTLAARLGSRYLRQDRLPAPWDIELEVWGRRGRRGGVALKQRSAGASRM